MREAIADRFNPGDPRAAVFTAYLEATTYEISTFLRGIFSFLPVPLVIGRAAALWDKYYKPGRMQAETLGDNAAALALSDFPADELFCPTVEAWLTVAAGFLKLPGGKSGGNRVHALRQSRMQMGGSLGIDSIDVRSERMICGS